MFEIEKRVRSKNTQRKALRHVVDSLNGLDRRGVLT